MPIVNSASNPSPRRMLGAALCGLLLLGAVHLAGCTADPAPQNAHAAALDNYVQGVLAYNKGDAEQALKDLQLAVVQHPTFVMAHTLLGDVYQSKRNYKSALVQYRATTRLDPYSFKNYYKEGLTLQLLNRVREAIAAYLRALELNPDDALTAQNLGVAYLSVDDLTNAIKYCRRAVELDDRSAPARYNLGVTLEAARDYKEAEKTFRAAMELDGSRLEIPEALAQNLVKQNRLSEAESVMHQVVRLGDSANRRKQLGDILSLEHKSDDALREYTRALEMEPRYFRAWNEVGRTRIAQFIDSLELDDEKRLMALEAWRKSLQIKPDQPRIAELIHSYTTRRRETLH